MTFRMIHTAMRLAAVAAAAVCLAGGAAQAALPPEVALAYARYVEAREAGDAEATAEAADAAFEAGDDALDAGEPGVDAMTVSALAENAAAARFSLSQFGEASALFARAAELRAEAEGDTLAVAQLWRLAGDTAYRAGDDRAMSRHHDAAGDLLERLPQSAERDLEIYRARAGQAAAAWRARRTQVAGQRALEAFDAAVEAGAPLDAQLGFIAYIAGVGRAIVRDDDRAAYYLTAAYRLFAADPNADRELATIAQAWSIYARTRLSETVVAGVLERLQAAGVTTDLCGDACPEPTPWWAQFGEDAEIVDAVAVRRAAPRYPRDAAAAGLEGVAVVSFDVTEEGRVENVETIVSAPHPIFAEDLPGVMRRWRYEPARVNGEPVRREGVVAQFEYVLQE